METVIGPLIPITYLVFVVAERLFPGRRDQPRVARWSLKGFLFFALGGVINGLVAPRVIGWASAHRLLGLAGLGTVAGALVALLASDLINYWWHRARHAWTPLWRMHQLHHSAERLDAVSAFYFHPLESVIGIGLGSLVGGLLGLSAGAAALSGYLFFFLAVFQHANLRTPRFLGYLVQRPEQHAMHHRRGVHAGNYGGTALWDRVFGTYRAPGAPVTELGFWDGASRRLGAMLVGRDVTTAPVSK